MSAPGSEQSQVLILGLGNVLLQDEGVGVHVVKQLDASYKFDPPVDLIDGGTAGLDLLPEFDDRERVIIVDAVDFDQEPGYIGLIEGADILTRLQTKLSIHHLGLADILSAARLLDKTPEHLLLVGVQPQSMEPKLELTTAVISVVPRVIEAVLYRLKEWGISHIRQANVTKTEVLSRS